MTLTLQIFEKKSDNLVGKVDIHAGESFKIGRNPAVCDVKDFRLRDRKISQQHVEIHNDGKQIRLVDLGSTNGTRLDGEDFRSNSVTLAPERFKNGNVEFDAGEKYRFILKLVGIPDHADTGTEASVSDDLQNTLVEPDSGYIHKPSPKTPIPEQPYVSPSKPEPSTADSPPASQEVFPDPIKTKSKPDPVQRDDKGMEIQIKFDTDDLDDDNW